LYDKLIGHASSFAGMSMHRFARKVDFDLLVDGPAKPKSKLSAAVCGYGYNQFCSWLPAHNLQFPA
jgi:hypothetical protein